MLKWCYSCKEWKNTEEFYKDKSRTDGLNAKCRNCTNTKNKIYENNNKEKIKIRKQKYYENNREKILERNKKYNKENKDRNSTRTRNKRRNSPILRLRCNISRLIFSMIKEQNKSKNSSILEYLPYTIEELKLHLEKQFEPWMSWENYGRYNKDIKRWNIDHIIPQSLLPYDSMEHENFTKCWALQNLRPLEAIKNIIKKDKLSFL